MTTVKKSSKKTIPSGAKRSVTKRPKTAKGKLPPKPTLVSTKLAYKGPLFSVLTQGLREPNGTVHQRDVVKHNGSVVILAVDETNKMDPIVIMERQYRPAPAAYLWELPAGKRDDGETPIAAAKRELIEETGYRAKKWTKLVRYYASPGFLAEWMEVWLAQGITEGVAEPEDDEHIQLVRMPLSELMEMVETGKIMDGKTIVGASIYAAWRRKGKV